MIGYGDQAGLGICGNLRMSILRAVARKGLAVPPHPFEINARYCSLNPNP